MALAIGAAQPVDIITAGTPPPFAINLRIGLAEAAVLSVITGTGFFSALAMREQLTQQPAGAPWRCSSSSSWRFPAS